MVKMMTTEPSVELKLKKGGHVAKKAFGGATPAPISVTGKLAARGGSMDGAAPGKPSMSERRKAMSGALLNSKKGGKVKHEDAAQDRAMIKKALAGKKFASGGAIDKAETKTTIEGNAGKFAKTKMDTSKKDKAHGTGSIKEGKPAAYKRGGHATGGAIPSDTHESKNKAKTKMGGTLEGNERDYVSTEMHSAKRDKAHGTGGIKETNAGGFKKGGSIDWENRPANGTPPGKMNGTTGGVREANAGGFKKGGAAKKHYATGGAVNDAGRSVAMPKKPVSAPVKNTMQSGTFKKGGKVAHKADGGSMDDQQMPMRDLSGGAYGRSVGPDQSDMDLANSIRNAPGNAMNAMMRLLGKRPSAGAGRGMVNPRWLAKKAEAPSASKVGASAPAFNWRETWLLRLHPRHCLTANESPS
jgi:hypothetical protein